MTKQIAKDCYHEWVVFSTDIGLVCLLVQCVKCGAIGTVDDPTKKEWSDAFHAPSNPYDWTDKCRVTKQGVSEEPYVTKVSK